jgi:hypothetical protein
MQSLFPDEPVDVDALAAIAKRSICRSVLKGTYLNVCKSSDLFEFGYSVSHWIRPRVAGSEVIEYNPIANGGRGDFSSLPRLTASNYDQQREIHEALKIRIVSPGRRF